MVVPVLITSCHVSENPKIGPVTAHSKMITKDAMKAAGLPVSFVTFPAKSSKNLLNPLLLLVMVYNLVVIDYPLVVPNLTLRHQM